MMLHLPKEYVSYVQSGGVTSGFTSLEWGGYFDLEPLEAVDQFNDSIQIDKHMAGFTAFASNGGGEFYAFDEAGIVYSIPLIGMNCEDAKVVAPSWLSFVAALKPAT